jgi:hypothetical protein
MFCNPISHQKNTLAQPQNPFLAVCQCKLPPPFPNSNATYTTSKQSLILFILDSFNTHSPMHCFRDLSWKQTDTKLLASFRATRVSPEPLRTHGVRHDFGKYLCSLKRSELQEPAICGTVTMGSPRTRTWIVKDVFSEFPPTLLFSGFWIAWACKDA